VCEIAAGNIPVAELFSLIRPRSRGAVVRVLPEEVRVCSPGRRPRVTNQSAPFLQVSTTRRTWPRWSPVHGRAIERGPAFRRAPGRASARNHGSGVKDRQCTITAAPLVSLSNTLFGRSEIDGPLTDLRCAGVWGAARLGDLLAKASLPDLPRRWCISVQWCQNSANKMMIGIGIPSSQSRIPLPKPMSLLLSFQR
jgi:hypothetical protein